MRPRRRRQSTRGAVTAGSGFGSRQFLGLRLEPSPRWPRLGFSAPGVRFLPFQGELVKQRFEEL